MDRGRRSRPILRARRQHLQPFRGGPQDLLLGTEKRSIPRLEAEEHDYVFVPRRRRRRRRRLALKDSWGSLTVTPVLW